MYPSYSRTCISSHSLVDQASTSPHVLGYLAFHWTLVLNRTPPGVLTAGHTPHKGDCKLRRRNLLNTKQWRV